mgnify:CR=1 FL=1
MKVFRPGEFDSDFLRRKVKVKEKERRCVECGVEQSINNYHRLPSGTNSKICKGCYVDEEHVKAPVVKATQSYERVNLDAPCNRCTYENACLVLELNCPAYRFAVSGNGMRPKRDWMKKARYPDRHLDGSPPLPGVVDAR